MARLPVSPSGSGTPSALRTVLLSPLDGWPAHTPADASPRPSRADTHGSGPMWVATPSSRRTRTSYLPPVSRRTPGLFTRPYGMGDALALQSRPATTTRSSAGHDQ